MNKTKSIPRRQEILDRIDHIQLQAHEAHQQQRKLLEILSQPQFLTKEVEFGLQMQFAEIEKGLDDLQTELEQLRDSLHAKS